MHHIHVLTFVYVYTYISIKKTICSCYRMVRTNQPHFTFVRAPVPDSRFASFPNNTNTYP